MVSDDSPDYDVRIDADELLADLVEQAQDYAEDHTEKREWWHDSFDTATEWTEARYWMQEARGGLKATSEAIAALQPETHTIHVPNCRNDDGNIRFDTEPSEDFDVAKFGEFFDEPTDRTRILLKPVEETPFGEVED